MRRVVIFSLALVGLFVGISPSLSSILIVNGTVVSTDTGSTTSSSSSTVTTSSSSYSSSKCKTMNMCGSVYCNPNSQVCVGSTKDNCGCCKEAGDVWPSGATGAAVVYKCVTSSGVSSPIWTLSSSTSTGTSTDSTCNPTTSSTTCEGQPCLPSGDVQTDKATKVTLTCTRNSSGDYVWTGPTSTCIPPQDSSSGVAEAPAVCKKSATTGKTTCSCIGTSCNTEYADPSYIASHANWPKTPATAASVSGIWKDWDGETLMVCGYNSSEEPVWKKVSSSSSCANLSNPITGKLYCTSKRVKSLIESTATSTDEECCSSQETATNGQGSAQAKNVYTELDLSNCGIDRTSMSLTKCDVSWPDGKNLPPFQTNSDGTYVTDSSGNYVLMYQPTVTLSDGVLTFMCYGGGKLQLDYSIVWETTDSE